MEYFLSLQFWSGVYDYGGKYVVWGLAISQLIPQLVMWFAIFVLVPAAVLIETVVVVVRWIGPQRVMTTLWCGACLLYLDENIMLLAGMVGSLAFVPEGPPLPAPASGAPPEYPFPPGVDPTKWRNYGP